MSKWQMTIKEKTDNTGFLIYTTSRRNNQCIFDSTTDLSNYKRKDLANMELFLREKYEQSNNSKIIQTADKIKTHLGKIIRASDCKNDFIPDGNYHISVELRYLKEKIEKDIEELGLDLDPDFQRAHVWTMKQRISFMEFILQGGKSNPIYFNHEGWMKSFDGEYVIVDGKQRLTSILMFLNNEFTVFKDKDPEGIGYFAKNFDTFSSTIEFIVNDLPNRELVLKWYLQMNKGNVAHTREELEKVENMLNNYQTSKSNNTLDKEDDIELD